MEAKEEKGWSAPIGDEFVQEMDLERFERSHKLLSALADQKDAFNEARLNIVDALNHVSKTGDGRLYIKSFPVAAQEIAKRMSQAGDDLIRSLYDFANFFEDTYGV